jgi:L-fuconolactonase
MSDPGTASQSLPEPGTQAWLDSVIEDVIDPEAPIIDPHHHLWPEGGSRPYGLDELLADLSSGHRIVDTVFVECGAAYRSDGPVELRPVGETEFVAVEAERAPRQVMGGVVAHADLTDADRLDAVLDAHEEAAGGRLRGIRHAGSHALHPEVLTIPGRALRRCRLPSWCRAPRGAGPHLRHLALPLSES